MNVLQSLQSLNAYPIPDNVINNICMARMINPEQEINAKLINSKEYQLAKADIMTWLSYAPNIDENGVSYQIAVATQENLTKQADTIYRKYGEIENTEDVTKTKYGYKGDKL